MLAIGLRFPSGRFHATPWGRHVNEGVPEWPPSPWRILRSLVGVWKSKANHLKETQVRGLLEALVAPPVFSLPRATIGNTRHYMRWYKKGPEDQTLVLDTFVAVDRTSELVVVWPDAQLDDRQLALLGTLLPRLGYLGRAESWCEGRLLQCEEAAEANCQPLNGESPDAGLDLVRVLCADPATAFDDKHVRSSVNKGARSKKPLYDPAWHLCIETGQLHAEKWSDPPGSKWVTYKRPAQCFGPQLTTQSRSRPTKPRMQVARYALDSTVLPLTTETLPFAELTRAALMGSMPKREGVRLRSATFSGKDTEGNPLKGHGHAYYIPADEDGDGRLDHLTVVAESGFEREEIAAIDRLQHLKRKEQLPETNLLLLGLGRRDQFSGLIFGPAQHWVSATPFLVTRHPKKRGRKRDPQHLLGDPHAFIEQVLREELERFLQLRELQWKPESVEVERLEDLHGVFRVDPNLWVTGATGARLRPIQFKRFRSRKRNDDGGHRLSGVFRITFPEAVRGPVSLGYSSHFGMGLFLPTRLEGEQQG
jgi:CRISPR-associated protein Csb2